MGGLDRQHSLSFLSLEGNLCRPGEVGTSVLVPKYWTDHLDTHLGALEYVGNRRLMVSVLFKEN